MSGSLATRVQRLAIVELGMVALNKIVSRFAAVSKGKKVKEQKEKGSLTAKTQPPQHTEIRHNRNDKQGRC
jgi:hypothetical protein